MPKNDLDLEYLPIDPATVQPGEPVASSGGILSYVENPEGFFLMLKKQISALQYRADLRIPRLNRMCVSAIERYPD